MTTPLKVWRLPPEKVAAYAPRMDLGEPDEIKIPESIVDNDEIFVVRASMAQKRKKEGTIGGKRKSKLSLDAYLEFRREGLSRDQICERVNLSRSALNANLRKWGISKTAQECEMIRQIGQEGDTIESTH
ncbi:hypothetical protein H7B90_00805 [Cohnella xylanilytica]|uniref:Homeodomain-like domain-containing protein n=1 Tax=Cohnella xylanilytica TaxID=557555 RepID=A0A841TVB5_9BACL|nr:hypothetical protein [Cohnella xylanilytica]MBB6689931.1 hypothetical protein [Cohnella xylanilytica]